jgi:nitrate reductase gamma subunit
MGRILGLVIFAVGIVILAFGINASQAVPEKALEAVTGKYTGNTMMYIIGGVAMIVGGIALAWRSSSK